MKANFLLLLALPIAALSQSTEGSTEGPVEGTSEGPVVAVAQGQLRGLHIDRSPASTLRTLYAFKGVPYARPPVGSLRFQDPQEPESWTGIRNATAYGSPCIQMGFGVTNVSGEEDCLYLNVFTADSPEDWTIVKRPVIVFFHGGAFIQWRGDLEFSRPDPLLRQGLVIVTMNYRLGVMGFLNTEDTQAPGNAGLKDQAMALRWVLRNIAAFGGDPSKVTIMGESAGGASVHLHVLSPYSRGLFRGAISVSGSALPPWTRVQQPRRNALALRRIFNASCSADAPDAIVPCLQKVDARELVSRQNDVPLEQFQNYFLKHTFRPAAEAPGSSSAPFLPAEPEQLMQNGSFAQVPYMTGYTTGEGILFLYYGRLLKDPSRWAEVDDNFADIFRWEMPPGLRTREAALRVRSFYLGDRSLRNATADPDTMQRFVQLLSDVFFTVGSVTSARMMADQGGSLYVYQFSRDGPIGFIKDLFRSSHIPGVMHGDDMMYVFDYTDFGAADPRPIPPSEVPIRERQAKIFANMVKTGNPSPEGSGLPTWPLFSAPQENYLDMGQELRVQPHALGERIAFWRLLASDQAQQQTTTERA